MPRANTTHLLDQLDDVKNQFAPNVARRIERLLNQLARKDFNDTDSLVRYHEILLFLRAYPHNPSIVRVTEKELRGFSRRVAEFREREIDIAPLEHPEVSGIAGTSVTDTFGFYIVRRLLLRHPSGVALDWEWFEDENRFQPPKRFFRFGNYKFRHRGAKPAKRCALTDFWKTVLHPLQERVAAAEIVHYA